MVTKGTAVKAEDIIKQLETLAADVQAAHARHAVAQQQYAQAQTVLTRAETQLRDLGIDPSQIETAIPAKLAEVEAESARVREALTAALENYDAIDAAVRKLV
jgi:multidrug efflux pump subunit AcrA (membrane-fusion protein)